MDFKIIEKQIKKIITTTPNGVVILIYQYLSGLFMKSLTLKMGTLISLIIIPFVAMYTASKPLHFMNE